MALVKSNCSCVVNAFNNGFGFVVENLEIVPILSLKIISIHYLYDNLQF